MCSSEEPVSCAQFEATEVISHASEFVNQVCNEIWKVEGGVIAERTKKDKK